MSELNRIPPGVYQHYDGEYYEVLDIGFHTETKEEYVVYRGLYAPFRLWLCPLPVFLEPVEVDGKVLPPFLLIRRFGDQW